MTFMQVVTSLVIIKHCGMTIIKELLTGTRHPMQLLKILLTTLDSIFLTKAGDRLAKQTPQLFIVLFNAAQFFDSAICQLWKKIIPLRVYASKFGRASRRESGFLLLF